MNPNDGGLAYPSLRDYFAGCALIGILSAPEKMQNSYATESKSMGLSVPDGIAAFAYHYADAMLRAKENGND